VEWEKAARQAEALGVRVALPRIGIVLAKEGGALANLLTPFKLYVGGRMGSGNQWMSWIHLADMVGLLLLALDHTGATGPINGTAPEPVTNKEFTQSLSRALHRPALLPSPRFMLRAMLGEVADVVATGQRVLPRRALELHYAFQFPNLDGALANILA
jgi:uncharacterized protein (TIGR01777 family)